MSLLDELRVFRSQPANVRALLAANAVYALAAPVIDLFTSAFVMRNTRDVRLVMAYQLALYAGIPVSFVIAGRLFSRVRLRRLYALGVSVSGLALVAMMALPDLTILGIIGIGAAQGMAQGLMWSSRNYLAVACTRDDNRNYYCGVESFCGVLAGVVVPLVVGGFIELAGQRAWFADGRRTAYLLVSVAGLAATLAAAAILGRGSFPQPPRMDFVFWRFHALWKCMQLVTIVRGVGQGLLAGVPAMLVLTLVGGEGILGILQSAGGLVAALLLYQVGRRTSPGHRLAILVWGLALIAVGCLANALLYDAVGVSVLVCCLLLGRPLMDQAYGPLQWLATDAVARAEGRSTYAYIFSAEICFFVGRLMGGGLFILIATCVSEEAALRYLLVAMVLVQGLSLLLVRPIVAGCRAISA